MTSNEKLAHALKVQFGLAPQEPNEEQLLAIKTTINRIQQSGRNATVADWRAAVAAACSTFGQWIYKGLDNSDLNVLLALAGQAASGGKG